MNFYDDVWRAICEADPKEKGDRVEKLYTKIKNGEIFSDIQEGVDGDVQSLKEPSYAAFATIVPPRKVPRRKHFDTPEGQAALLHAVAHIEYSAIDLALDSAYRFRGMPEAYYLDWIEVAHDEVRHFRMLEKLMGEIGVRYGDYPVHTSLFEAGKRSGGDPLERMAVVPRYLEAGGLDANPKIIEKLRSYPATPMITAIIEALETILAEEVGHVFKGDRWFRYLCDQRGLDTTIYFEILERHYPGFSERPMRLNVKARRAAGFACDELKRMGAKRCE
jgi:uncharacterized ferritin-like protein (DUF455 family)